MRVSLREEALKGERNKQEEWNLPPIIEAHCPSCNALLIFPSSAREVLCPVCQKHLTVCCEIIVNLNEEKDRGRGNIYIIQR